MVAGHYERDRGTEGRRVREGGGEGKKTEEDGRRREKAFIRCENGESGV